MTTRRRPSPSCGSGCANAMHVAIVSYHYDQNLTSPEEALQRYDTTVGWAEGLAEAGARVSVVMRFSSDHTVRRPEACYRFIHDPTLRMGSLLDRAERVNQVVAELRPDVVHVDGLPFARQAARLRSTLPGSAIALQDHANRPPRQRVNRTTLARAMREIDGFFFSAKELAQPWIEARIVPPRAQVYEVMESSSRFTPGDRSVARRHTGLAGEPLLLWVGRLNENKDPLAVLEAFDKASADLGRARLVTVFHTEELRAAVEAWLQRHPRAAAHVRLLGYVEHADLEAVYRSADLFVLGSHHEGSGYALLEALACGVTPVVTDIPSFRALAGGIGFLWPPGDVDACTQAILQAARSTTGERRAEIRAWFEARFSFAAIGQTAFAAYRELLDARRGRTA